MSNLFEFQALVRTEKAPVIIINQRVRDALEVTKVLQFFSLHPSVAEAESAASNP